MNLMNEMGLGIADLREIQAIVLISRLANVSIGQWDNSRMYPCADVLMNQWVNALMVLRMDLMNEMGLGIADLREIQAIV